MNGVKKQYLPQKFVLPVAGLLPGAKNGKRFGMGLNTVQRNAGRAHNIYKISCWLIARNGCDSIGTTLTKSIVF
jgi:hypothetical protein